MQNAKHAYTSTLIGLSFISPTPCIQSTTIFNSKVNYCNSRCVMQNLDFLFLFSFSIGFSMQSLRLSLNYFHFLNHTTQWFFFFFSATFCFNLACQAIFLTCVLRIVPVFSAINFLSQPNHDFIYFVDYCRCITSTNFLFKSSAAIMIIYHFFLTSDRSTITKTVKKVPR